MVAVAEKEGKTVELLVVPGVNPFRRAGPDRRQGSGFATGHRSFGSHGFRGTGAADRQSVGTTSGTETSVFAGNHFTGPAVRFS